MEAREGSVDGIIFDKIIVKMSIIAKKKKVQDLEFGPRKR